MKPRIKKIIWICGAIVLVGILLEAGLAYVSRTQWFKTRVTNALTSAFGRDIRLARMGASLRGIIVEDLHVAERGGFEEGIFAQMGRLRMRVSLLHLLKGHIKVKLVVLSDAKVKLCCASFLGSKDKKRMYEEIKSKAYLFLAKAKKISDDEYVKNDFYQKIVFDNTICEYKNFISMIEGLEKA